MCHNKDFLSYELDERDFVNCHVVHFCKHNVDTNEAFLQYAFDDVELAANNKDEY